MNIAVTINFYKPVKRIFWFLVAVCLLSLAAVGQNRVVAEITNFKNDKGVCRACLFNTPSAFRGETGEPYKCVAVPVKNKIAQAVFDVQKGTYALFVFHDENENNKMDKNFLGIPKEGYGASKNKLPFAAAPRYDENKFLVEDNRVVTLRVKLRNL